MELSVGRGVQRCISDAFAAHLRESYNIDTLKFKTMLVLVLGVIVTFYIATPYNPNCFCANQTHGLFTGAKIMCNCLFSPVLIIVSLIGMFFEDSL